MSYTINSSNNKVSSCVPARSAFVVLMTVASLAITGCGFFGGEDGVFRNRENDYLKADSIPPLVLPAGTPAHATGELYPIPPISSAEFGYDPTATEFEVPRPMPLADNLQEEKVKIQRVGEESWILLNVSPGEVWPRIRNFLNVNDLTVSRADISKGIIETSWLQFKTDPNTYDRYRLQVDQGVQPETSEIHVTHMSVPVNSVKKTALDWPKRSMNPEREKWLMDELAATLAADSSEGGTSLLAQAIGGSVKASLGMRRGEPTLTIKLDRQRALATLSYSAKHGGFTTFESDAEEGFFYIDYRNPEDDKPGWFARTFHIGGKPKVLTTPYSLAQIKANALSGEAFDNAPTSNRKKEKVNPGAPGYILVVSGDAEEYLVRIRDPYGKRLTLHDARELLTLLRKNLI